MSTTLKSNDIQSRLSDLLKLKSFDDKAEFEAKMIMAEFLSEIEPILAQRRIKRKDLANLIGTSPSFITQLYRGTKVINLSTIAKIILALDITLDVKIKSKADNLDSFDKQIGNYLQSIIKHNNGRYSCIYRVFDIDNYDGEFSEFDNQLVA